jgi:uncharacterized membrane protein
MEAENIIFAIMYIIIGLILIVISNPLRNGKVAMNHVIGVRLKKSFTSEKNWYLMNSYGGRQLMIWSVALVVLGVLALFVPFNGNESLIILFAFLPVIVLIIPTFLIVRYSRTLGDV